MEVTYTFILVRRYMVETFYEAIGVLLAEIEK
jgi:hypothetical protein